MYLVVKEFQGKKSATVSPLQYMMPSALRLDIYLWETAMNSK
jgi:hypothetical protein